MPKTKLRKETVYWREFDDLSSPGSDIAYPCDEYGHLLRPDAHMETFADCVRKASIGLYSDKGIVPRVSLWKVLPPQLFV